jgi:glutamate-1-semialdehyde aminotransferase
MRTLKFKPLTVASGLVCLSVLYTVSAYAQSTQAPTAQVFEGAKTRAEVRAELFQAMKDGTMPQMTEGADYPRIAQSSASTKTRDEVRAELFQAIKDGTLISNSDWDYPKMAKTPPSLLTREAVRADTIEWLRVHRNDVMMGGN